ncbi:MAG: hypothetical protein EDX89_22830 [Acidobacteria bacterium]|nr:MAG: hypothetical protein EDX89_22830 [Acidobacteriota bacterium]
MRGRRARSARGSSLVEVLIAIAILALMMVGVLQMFSVALVTNYGSAARTEMTYKAQQVVENLRMIYFLGETNPAVFTASGVPATMAATSVLTWAFWGPSGANCVEPSSPYRLAYSVTDGGAFWIVTVTATPKENPQAPIAGPTPAPGDRTYLGSGSKLKRVDYVAQLPK